MIRALLASLLISSATASERLSHTDPDASRYQFSTTLMTTRIDFTLITQDQKKAEEAVTAAINEMERIEAVFSEWQPESEISLVNRSAATHPVSVSTEVLRLVSEALAFSELTSGAFDITYKSAGKLWDFRDRQIPSPEQLATAVRAIDYHRVIVDSRTETIAFTHPGTEIGLGGIAKGYAVDRAVQVIRNHGFDEFSVNAGGDLYAASKGQKKLWRVGVQHPRDDQTLAALLPVANAAVATSGDYERYFEQDGIRYHHILNPATGLSARGSMSVTVLAPRTYLADALATGVFILGPEKGLALIEGLNNCEAMVIDEHGNTLLTKGLKPLIQVPVNAP